MRRLQLLGARQKIISRFKVDAPRLNGSFANHRIVIFFLHARLQLRLPFGGIKAEPYFIDVAISHGEHRACSIP